MLRVFMLFCAFGGVSVELISIRFVSFSLCSISTMYCILSIDLNAFCFSLIQDISFPFPSSKRSLPPAVSLLRHALQSIYLPDISFTCIYLPPFVYFKSYLLQALSPPKLISCSGNYLLWVLSPRRLIYAASPLQPRLHKTLALPHLSPRADPP